MTNEMRADRHSGQCVGGGTMRDQRIDIRL